MIVGINKKNFNQCQQVTILYMGVLDLFLPLIERVLGAFKLLKSNNNLLSDI